MPDTTDTDIVCNLKNRICILSVLLRGQWLKSKLKITQGNDISFSGDSLKLNETFISHRAEMDKRIYHLNIIRSYIHGNN